jgi:adenylate cyclase
MAQERTQRRLAAILAADVVGFAAMNERDEQGTFERLRAHRNELLEPQIARHKGSIFKLTGDGLLAEFASAIDAVDCAVALQEGMVERNSLVPESQRISFRIGINLGDVIVEDNDRHGDGVIIAARLEGLAEPGGICVSGKVHDEVVNRTNWQFEKLGEQRLKNIGRAIQVFRVVGSQNQRTSSLTDQMPNNRISIAVLPFVNLSNDVSQQYFSDGITEDIITELARFSYSVRCVAQCFFPESRACRRRKEG